MKNGEDFDELFTQAIACLSNYLSDTDLDSAMKQNLSEAISRLRDLPEQYMRIRDLNYALLETDEGLNKIRGFTTEENINKMLHKNAGNDPKLARWLDSVGGKIAKMSSTEVSFRDLTKIDPDNNHDRKIKDLHSITEAVYENLWTVKVRLNTLPKFQKFNPPKVRSVRNDLIVHTDGKGSGATIFSFGVATNGPVLRPIKPRGAKAAHDNGFEGNIKEFLEQILI